MNVIIDKQEMNSIISELSDLIALQYNNESDLMLVGIERRGADLAKRLYKDLECRIKALRFGILDINFYRDDWTSLADRPVIRQSQIPTINDHTKIILVDDVIYTGRTVRAALDALLDYGRPKMIKLLVLIDRGLRELPIQADYVGKTVNTNPNQRVDVLLEETDGLDEVRVS